MIFQSHRTKVSAKQGRLDRMKCDVVIGVASGDFESLEIMSRILNGAFARDECPRFNNLFTLPQRSSLQVRKQYDPLFGGQLRFFPMRPGGCEYWLVKLSLDFSFARLGRRQGKCPKPDRPVKLYGRKGIGCPKGERGLDGKDNWILKGNQDRFFELHHDETLKKALLSIRSEVSKAIREVEQVGRKHEAKNLTVTYLEDFTEDEARLLSLMDSVPSSANTTPFYPWSLQEVEVYWELDCENAVSRVEALQPFLKGAASSSEAKFYSFGTGRNSPSLSLALSSGAKLTIYAKTDRRIRFETRFDVSKNSQLLRRPHPTSPEKETTSKTALTVDKLAEIIDHLRQRAEKETNRIFDFLQDQEQARQDSSTTSYTDPVDAVLKAYDRLRKALPSLTLKRKREILCRVLRIVHSCGSIACKGLPSEEKRVVEALKAEGILVYDQGCRGYRSLLFRNVMPLPVKSDLEPERKEQTERPASVSPTSFNPPGFDENQMKYAFLFPPGGSSQQYNGVFASKIVSNRFESFVRCPHSNFAKTALRKCYKGVFRGFSEEQSLLDGGNVSKRSEKR